MTRDRLWGRILFVPGGCWEWLGAKTTGGYGLASIDGKLRYVHREFYEMQYGNIAPGLVIDHLCRTRHCVNPLHMEAVSQTENKLRGVGAAAVNAAKAACVRGHALSIRNDGRRRCLTCTAASMKKWVAEHPTYEKEWRAARRERTTQ